MRFILGAVIWCFVVRVLGQTKIVEASSSVSNITGYLNLFYGNVSC